MTPKFIKLTKPESKGTFYINSLHVVQFLSREEGGSYIETVEAYHSSVETPAEILALIEKPCAGEIARPGLKGGFHDPDFN